MTHPAYEARRMPLRFQRRHVILHYGTGTSFAFGREIVEIVVATVRFTVALVEAVVAELFAALGAEKVLGVPRLVQRCHAFLR